MRRKGAVDMYKIGDMLIYSTYGICRVEDICKMSYHDGVKLCYVLRPIEESNLTINTPVDNKKVVMLDLMDRETADKVMASFKESGVKWISDSRKRAREYNKLTQTGDRLTIAQVLNTYMVKEIELSKQKKKLHIQDRKILESIQTILFKELALIYQTTVEKIINHVTDLLESRIVIE